MGRVIAFDTFRTLRACRKIEEANAEILGRLSDMKDAAGHTKAVLDQAGRTLEHTLDQFELARQKLHRVNAQHERVMKVVDHIMDSSPAFRQ